MREKRLKTGANLHYFGIRLSPLAGRLGRKPNFNWQVTPVAYRRLPLTNIGLTSPLALTKVASSTGYLLPVLPDGTVDRVRASCCFAWLPVFVVILRPSTGRASWRIARLASPISVSGIVLPAAGVTASILYAPVLLCDHYIVFHAANFFCNTSGDNEYYISLTVAAR